MPRGKPIALIVLPDTCRNVVFVNFNKGKIKEFQGYQGSKLFPAVLCACILYPALTGKVFSSFKYRHSPPIDCELVLR